MQLHPVGKKQKIKKYVSYVHLLSTVWVPLRNGTSCLAADVSTTLKYFKVSTFPLYLKTCWSFHYDLTGSKWHHRWIQAFWRILSWLFLSFLCDHTDLSEATPHTNYVFSFSISASVLGRNVTALLVCVVSSCPTCNRILSSYLDKGSKYFCLPWTMQII